MLFYTLSKVSRCYSDKRQFSLKFREIFIFLFCFLEITFVVPWFPVWCMILVLLALKQSSLTSTKHSNLKPIAAQNMTLETKYHKEGISNPQTAPAFRAARNRSFLAVNSNCHSWGLTNWAATDIWLNVFFCHRHHWKRCCSWEPVGFIIATCIVTNVPRVTVEEWHGAKTRQTWASQPC